MKNRTMLYFCNAFFLGLSLLWLGIISSQATAVSTTAENEARLKALSQELRCLVCQNQTLADSSAPLAEDLRNEIRTLMTQGKSDAEITEYLVARYGDFVRYRPPLNTNTMLLWAGPMVLLVLSLWIFWRVLRHRNNILHDDIGEGEEA